MKIDTPLILGLFSFIAAIAGVLYSGRNASKSNQVNQGAQQLQWTKQAMDEANEAKTEAREAKTEAESATKQARELTFQMNAVMDWVDRVIRAAHRDDVTQIGDPAVQRLLTTINGGPDVPHRP